MIMSRNRPQMMFPAVLTLCLSILLSACDRNGSAQTSSEVSGSGSDASPDNTQPSGAPADSAEPLDVNAEHLLADVPEGWLKVYESLLDTQRMVEYVPEGSSGDNWQEKISFESFSHKPLPDPIDLVTSIARDQKETCEGFEDHNTFSGYENEYPTSVRLLVCKNDKLTHQGQVTLIKTILGEDNFYVITRARRIPPIAEEASGLSAEDMALWSLYLRAISVCDPGRENHPCPDSPASP